VCVCVCVCVCVHEEERENIVIVCESQTKLFDYAFVQRGDGFNISAHNIHLHSNRRIDFFTKNVRLSLAMCLYHKRYFMQELCRFV
jgi:hypothetical protein